MTTPKELLTSMPGLEHLCQPRVPLEILSEWADRGLFYCADMSVIQQRVGGPNSIEKVAARFVATTCDRLATGEPRVPVANEAFIANVRGGYFRDRIGGGSLGIASVLRASYDSDATLWVGEGDGSDGGQPVMAGVLSLPAKEARALKERIQDDADSKKMRVQYNQFDGGLESVVVEPSRESYAGFVLRLYENSLRQRGLTDQLLLQLGGLGAYFVYASEEKCTDERTALRVGVVECEDPEGVLVRSLPAQLEGKPDIRRGRSISSPIVRLDGTLWIMKGDDVVQETDVRSRFSAAYTGTIALVEAGVLTMPTERTKRIQSMIMRNGRQDQVHMAPGVDGYYLPEVRTLQEGRTTGTRNWSLGVFVRVKTKL